MINKRDNILLVSGTGQNCGKTSFICDLIKQVGSKVSLVGIKISPHFHPQNKNTVYVIQTNELEIIKEINKDGKKDSNRFLQAGSKKVYYIQTRDEHLPLVLDFIDQHIPTESAIVCESGGLNKLIKPGLFIEMFRTDSSKQKTRKNSDVQLEYKSKEYDSLLKSIEFKNNSWQLKNKII